MAVFQRPRLQGTWLPHLILTLTLIIHLTCQVLPVSGQPQAADRLVPEPACGTKFVDASSSALLADVVLKGSVQDLRQASPLTPLLYRAHVNVHKVYKGQHVLHAGQASNTTASRLTTVQIERFGPTENRENCVGHVQEGQSYIFFLKPKGMPDDAAHRDLSLTSHSSGRDRNNTAGASSSFSVPVLDNSALPQLLDPQTLRKVKKVLCPDCSSVPIIKRLKCKHCAVKPSMKRKMSANSTKTIRTGKRLSLRCVAKGTPRPTYTWLKDGALLYSQLDREGEGNGTSRGQGRSGSSGKARVFRSGKLSVRNSKHYSLLVVRKIRPEDEGMYRCLAVNPAGEVEQSVRVLVEGRSRSRPSQSDPEPQTTSSSGPCEHNPCYNGGSCYPRNGQPACQCLQDYHGNKCQFKRQRQSQQEVQEDETAEELTEVTTERESGGVITDDTADMDDNTSSQKDDKREESTVAQITAPTTVTNTYPLITTVGGPATVTDTHLLQPSSQPTSDTHRNVHLNKKRGRKHNTSARDSNSAKSSKTGGAPQLKVSECPDASYCLNGGTCKIVVKIQRRFCVCPRGFSGRRCERRF